MASDLRLQSPDPHPTVTIMRIFRSNSGILVLLLGLAAVGCGPPKEPPPQAPEQPLASMLKTLAKDWDLMREGASLAPEEIHSWIPECGIRGRYQIAKQVAGISALEALTGEKVFLSGPHSWDTLNFESTNDFGHYNPAFLVKLKELLAGVLADKSTVAELQGAYDKHLKQYLRTFLISYDVGANNRKVMDGYLAVISRPPKARGKDEFLSPPSKFLLDSFQEFSDRAGEQGYDLFEALNCAGFWVRRSIDGTEDEFHELLVMVMGAFDPAFLAAHGAREPAAR